MSEIPILEVVSSMQPGGGPAHVLALAQGLRGRAFSPVVAGPADGEFAGEFRAAGLEVVVVPTDRLSPAATGQLVRVIRARAIRLVHSHGKGAGLHARLAARATGVPAVHTYHGIHFEAYPAPARAAYLALERALARVTARVLCVSASEHAEALRRGLVTAGRTRVIPNGVDHAALARAALERPAARRMLGLDDGTFVVGTVARFDRVKALDVLIDAARTTAAAELVLIGDGAERPRLERAARGARVRFAGTIRGAARLLRAFDGYATASAKEGMPIALLEAMALGVPIVAGDIPAHRELLGADYPMTPRTPADFGQAFATLARDPDLRADLGVRAQRRARDFDTERTVEAIAGVYREVLML